MAVDEAGWTRREAVVNNVRLHWMEAGPGPPVLLLHGFPEHGWEWRHQLPALAAAGFRAVAPDLRGYNLSEKPSGVKSYRIERLVEDVRGLIRTMGAERAHVVGHDWGGVIAWWMGMLAPEQVDRLVVINAPHPDALRREMRNPAQVLRLWYAASFQIPLLPEAAFRRNDFALIEQMLRKSSIRPGAFSDEDIRRYREGAARPGAITAMLNYYRAAARHPHPPTRTLTRPTMLVWGERDQALTTNLAERLDGWVPGIRVERLPQATHWVPEEYPDEVNRLLIDFLSPR